jgi:multiple sugar transport system permease protein
MTTHNNHSSPSQPDGSYTGTWKNWRWSAGNFLFVLPFMTLFTIFTLIPIFYSMYMSLFDWEILAKEHTFIGFQNYVDLADDSLWWLSLRNTMIFAFMTAIGNTVFALVIAMGVDQPLRGRDFLRTVFYSPVVLSVAVMAIVLGWMMNTQFGILNYMLAWVGIPPIPWLATSRTVIPSLSLATIWWTFGFPMLIYLAGLQNIPNSLYDSTLSIYA